MFHRVLLKMFFFFFLNFILFIISIVTLFSSSVTKNTNTFKKLKQTRAADSQSISMTTITQK